MVVAKICAFHIGSARLSMLNILEQHDLAPTTKNGKDGGRQPYGGPLQLYLLKNETGVHIIFSCRFASFRPILQQRYHVPQDPNTTQAMLGLAASRITAA